MLQKSILNVKGAKALNKEEKKRIAGGTVICPSEGGVCQFILGPCLSGPVELCCVNGYWQCC